MSEFNPEVAVAKAATEKPQNRLLIAIGAAFVIINPINIFVYLLVTGIMYFIIGFQGGYLFLWSIPVYFIVFVIGAYLFLTLFNKVAKAV